MTSDKVKLLVKGYWIFYLIGLAAVFGIKYFYRKAGSDDLQWILTPTAWWVRILSGIPFEYEPHIGYINHHYRFIIAASCSGVQFMTITIATLIYSFVHRMRTMRRGFFWIILSFAISYFFTIFVNGFRIIVSIYLPIYLQGRDIYNGWMTPERLHTIIGTAVYFTSLFTIYHIAGYAAKRIAGRLEEKSDPISPKCSSRSFVQILRKCITPMFWYFAIALGIPLINRAYKSDYEKFAEYAMLMTVICLAIIVLFCVASGILKYFTKLKKSLGSPS